MRSSHCVAGVVVMLVSLACAPAQAEAPYRSVVIFGDTQDLVRTGREGLYRELVKMVDWVVENRERENIDFVLHVGDIIHNGYPQDYPLSAERCGQARPDPRAKHSDCRVDRECPAELPVGCFQSPSNRNRCFSCSLALWQTVGEWKRFRAQWRRLAEARIPYAVVRGDHDNVGKMQPGALDPAGYRLLYGKRHFESLGPWSGYLESFSDDGGVSHAWRFRIGDQPVLVIGISRSAPTTHLDWAERLLADPNQAKLPAILLTHKLYNGIPPRYDAPRLAWRRLVAPHPERFFMAVWGHVSPGDVDLLSLRRPGTERDHPLLRIRSNWQGQPGPRSYLTLVRFHRRPDARDQVEVHAFSPLAGIGYDRSPRHRGDTQATYGSTWLARRPFSIRREAAP